MSPEVIQVVWRVCRKLQRVVGGTDNGRTGSWPAGRGTMIPHLMAAQRSDSCRGDRNASQGSLSTNDMSHGGPSKGSGTESVFAKTLTASVICALDHNPVICRTIEGGDASKQLPKRGRQATFRRKALRWQILPHVKDHGIRLICESRRGGTESYIISLDYTPNHWPAIVSAGALNRSP